MKGSVSKAGAAGVLTLLVWCGAADPASAQNNGLPGQQESAVLITLIADRGEECELLRPWAAASLRAQNREQMERFDDDQRAAIQAAVEERRPAMGCDDGLLVAWTDAAGPNFEREYLPELLAGYRAFALQDSPPTAFTEATGRTDYAEAIARIDAKLEELATEGVQPPGGMTWPQLHARQSDAAAELAGIIAGTTTSTRDTPEMAERLVTDVATLTELWFADEG